jgi:hypothetical protein
MLVIFFCQCCGGIRDFQIGVGQTKSRIKQSCWALFFKMVFTTEHKTFIVCNGLFSKRIVK